MFKRKPLKTRIKKEELANGNVSYHPQYRWMGIWVYFEYAWTNLFTKSPELELPDTAWRNKKWSYNSSNFGCAEEIIHHYISMHNNLQEMKKRQKVVKIEYIKCP